MATDPSTDDLIARPGARAEGAASGAQSALEKFKALPRPMQMAIIIGGMLVFFWVMSAMRGGGNTQAPRQVVNLGELGNGSQVSSTFSGIETDRPAVMQSVFEQNRRDMADLRTKIEGDFATRDTALQTALEQNQELQRQMQQMMGDFTTELKNIQMERSRDNERLAQLADQQRQLELSAPVDGVGGSNPVGVRKRAISQVSLGGGGGVMGAVTRPFGQMAGATGASHLNNSGLPVPSPAEDAAAKRLPFMPPIGFVKATLLNGVDALVGGSATPALARLSGTYRTAMNTTVSLDGCFALLEFEGNISTERATGRPARMTCVYPDGGAATYSLSGYAVDADDGIIGVPGVLYEGDPTRITASILADFAAGMGQIIEDNSQQDTTVVGSAGNTTSFRSPTGNQTIAQIAGGTNKAMASLRDYLKARVDRTQSFIRLDATRDVHLVILTGTELRKEGDVWSSLFDGNSDAGLPESRLPAAQQQTTPPPAAAR